MVGAFLTALIPPSACVLFRGTLDARRRHSSSPCRQCRDQSSVAILGASAVTPNKDCCHLWVSSLLLIISPDVILCGWLGSKHQLTNLLLIQIVAEARRIDARPQSRYPLSTCDTQRQSWRHWRWSHHGDLSLVLKYKQLAVASVLIVRLQLSSAHCCPPQPASFFFFPWSLSFASRALFFSSTCEWYVSAGTLPCAKPMEVSHWSFRGIEMSTF